MLFRQRYLECSFFRGVGMLFLLPKCWGEGILISPWGTRVAPGIWEGQWCCSAASSRTRQPDPRPCAGCTYTYAVGRERGTRRAGVSLRLHSTTKPFLTASGCNEALCGMYSLSLHTNTQHALPHCVGGSGMWVPFSQVLCSGSCTGCRHPQAPLGWVWCRAHSCGCWHNSVPRGLLDRGPQFLKSCCYSSNRKWTRLYQREKRLTVHFDIGNLLNFKISILKMLN